MQGMCNINIFAMQDGQTNMTDYIDQYVTHVAQNHFRIISIGFLWTAQTKTSMTPLVILNIQICWIKSALIYLMITVVLGTWILCSEKNEHTCVLRVNFHTNLLNTDKQVGL